MHNYPDANLFKTVAERMKEGGCALKLEYLRLHVNSTISEILILISHVNSIKGNINFFGIRVK